MYAAGMDAGLSEGMARGFPEVETWIRGERALGEAGETITLRNPNDGSHLAEFTASSPDQVDRAIGAANEIHESAEWFKLGAEGRAPVLLALADELDRRANGIAVLDALNSGVPISVTRLMASAGGEVVRDAVRRALATGSSYRLESEDRQVTVHRRPWGVAALVLPWNAPAATAVKKLAFALAAGVSVVMKPSSASPWSAAVIAEAAHEVGLPAGVLNVVSGGSSVGAQIVADPRVRTISMTGSTATGRSIAATAAPRFVRLNLELGSNNPALVLADADIEAAASSIVSGSAKLSGQWCEAPRRVIAARSIWRDVEQAIVEAYRSQFIASSLDERSTLGPVAFESRRAELRGQRETLRESGARITTIDAIPSEGWFFEPTVACGEQVTLGEEIFGPMLTVEPADDETEAISRANSGQTGLAGYVFGSDEQHAIRLAREVIAGEVKVNGTSVLDLAPESVQSFFGDSGLGGHGDATLLDFYTGAQIVGVDRSGLPL